MPHEFGNDPAKVERYRRFWNRAPTDRPLVGFSTMTWFPLDEFSASAAWPQNAGLTPGMVHPEDFLDEHEAKLREGEIMDDDMIRGACASQAVFWCCGTLGCTMRILPGNVVCEDRLLPWEECLGMKVDLEHPWFRKYVEYTDALIRRAAGRFPVSHGMLMGPLDYAVALRGHEQIVFDMMEEPENAARLLREMGDVFLLFTKDIWRRIPTYLGGHYDAQYRLWAPGTTARMQEDAIAVMSPALYREFIQPVDRAIAANFEYPFIHLHATSMIVLDELLEIREIKAFEVNQDIGGPAFRDMLPYLRKIQRAGMPLILRGELSVDEAKQAMEVLEPARLFLHLMVRDRAQSDALRPVVGM